MYAARLSRTTSLPPSAIRSTSAARSWATSSGQQKSVVGTTPTSTASNSSSYPSTTVTPASARLRRLCSATSALSRALLGLLMSTGTASRGSVTATT